MADLPVLCSDCSTVAINIPGAGQSRRAETEHLTLSKIKDGAEKGCHICTRLVRTTLSSLLTSGLSRLDSLRIQGIDKKAKVILSGEDEPLLADVTMGAAVLIRDLRVYTLADDPLASIIRSRPFTSGSASAEIFGLVKAWIRNCDSSHSECVRHEDTELPTRLLEVTVSGSNDVRLCVPRDRGEETGSYIALSYCWGRTPSLQTTTDTIIEHQKGIPYRALPGTIQDAVRITRALGVHYLWVDALCIIQGEDDNAKADWERESAKMHSVYGNSYVTISASGSSNCQLGMFLPRTPPRDPLFQFQAVCGSVRGHIYLESRKRAWLVSEEDPIDYRAWTLQERLLSPRVIKYGADAVYWECQTIQHSEFEDNMPMTKSLKHYRLPKKLRVEDWIDVIEDYSTRKLTVSNDRFIALSGIAHRFQKDQ
ncbi:heterokaryon incompatibility protein-domain-containing protein [Aspergillus terricola var. indicus]